MTKTVTLKHPITHGSQTITELVFRPLKAKDLRRLQSPHTKPMAMTLELAGYLSGQTIQVIDELQGEDVQEVIALVGGFIGGSQATGDASLED